MRRRRSRRYRWLPMALTAGGLALILLGGVAASPGSVPGEASAANVGLVADNGSATVVPNADFLRTRARVLEMLQEVIGRLRSSGAASASATADRLEVIAERLGRVTPSQPEELEAIVADLNREVLRGLVGRSSGSGTIRSSAARLMCDICEEQLGVLDDVLGILGDIIDVLRQLIERLYPPPPYVPPPYRPPRR